MRVIASWHGYFIIVYEADAQSLASELPDYPGNFGFRLVRLIERASRPFLFFYYKAPKLALIKKSV